MIEQFSPSAPARAALLDKLGAAADVLSSKVSALNEEDFRAASMLPGWSRGHVVAHLSNVCEAVARQVTYALKGELIDFYDGGQAGRTQAIEMNAGLAAAEHKARLDAALAKVLSALGELSEQQWQLPSSYRNSTIHEGSLALWRELVIHVSDLGVGRGPEVWSKEFCLYLLTFLADRVPEDTRLVLLPLGLEKITLGSGENTVSIQGMLSDITAWLAGREATMGSLRAEAAADSVALPALLPWPSPKS